MAVGAYASAVFSQKFGLPFIVSVPLAGLIAGVVGVVVGFPALRIKGIYLLLLTLGFSEIIQVVVLSWDYVGGAQGYRNIPFNRRTLEWVVAVVVLLILFFGRLERSSLGRAMDRSVRTRSRPRSWASTWCASNCSPSASAPASAGVAGALYAHQATYVELDHLQRDDVGRNPYFRRRRRRQHFFGAQSWARSRCRCCRNSCALLREWLQLLPVAWTDFYPMNEIYDFLYAFLDLRTPSGLSHTASS